MVTQRSFIPSSLVVRSALASGALAVALVANAAPVQAHSVSNGSLHAERASIAPAAPSGDGFKASTGKKAAAAESKAAKAERKKAERAAKKEAAQAAKAKKAGHDHRDNKVAKVEKSKSASEDSLNSVNDDPLEGL